MLCILEEEKKEEKGTGKCCVTDNVSMYPQSTNMSSYQFV